MTYLNPPSLVKGDTIGLIAPSSPLQPGRIESGTRYLKSNGFNVKLGRNLERAERFLAGTDQERAEDFMNFVVDPDVKAIMATAGGYGSQRLLPLLDYTLIKNHPKIVTGFSDTTALQLGLLKKAGLITFTGFTFRDTDVPEVDSLIDQTMMACLLGQPMAIQEGTPVKQGIAEGPLIGGNLECLAALMGTPYQPNFAGSILLIEDVFAEPFQTDCRLSQLYLAGIFDQVAGVIFGTFENCIARHNPERDGTINDVIQEWSSRINIPCIKDFPYGHIPRRCVLPIGKNIQFDAIRGSISWLD